PQLPAVHVHLLKNIPMGAGLGGGSADGSFMLQLLNDKFQLALSSQLLEKYALQLGSDCPFFISNKPCYATGRGELMEHIKLDLASYQLIIVNTGVHINTGWAFSQLYINKSLTKAGSVKQIIAQPPAAWRDQLLNDFETPVFEKYPEIKSVKDSLY
ncbi:MAG: 4-(cytidine 5'-diphospho)-2-C-methyl-D-erythritol kinase, partial [Bacteroidota bacterium]